MIRCGQMLLAATMLRHLGTSSKDNRQLILPLFADNRREKNSPFSIHNLVVHAAKNFSVKPGEWFRATTIMMSLDNMITEFQPPLCAKLRIHTAVDTLVGFNEIFYKMFPEEKLTGKQDYLKELRDRVWPSELLFCVAIRTGLHKPQANFKAALAKLISLPQCVGFLGGKESKAYYIVGYHENKQKYFYLDPHYVQESDPADNIDRRKHSPQNLYEYSYEDMVTSLLPAFHIRNERDFAGFHSAITALVMELGEDNVPFNFVETTEFDGNLADFMSDSAIN